MSNSAVGPVYEAVIDEVIRKSKEDFEDSGVDESVLLSLREGWKKKLSQLGVASFPWDPKPDSGPSGSGGRPAPGAPSALGPGSAGAGSNYGNQQLTAEGMGIALPNVSSAANGQHVKAEVLPKLEPEIKQEPGLNQDSFPDLAATRAQQALHKSYGPLAANSISAIQAGMSAQDPARSMRPQPPQAPVPGDNSQGAQVPQASQAQPPRRVPEYPGQQPQQGQPPQPGIPQTDGAGDYEAVMVERHADGSLAEMGRVEIDRMIHDRIMENARTMEGGGFMVSLREATKHSAPSRRPGQGKQGAHASGQLDGGDDEDDEDAINSDLDDSEDEHNDEDGDDEGLSHIMLCMYDKVQRVKNKWKCTLKDGVLTVNGKEYLFHKATGEYEW